MKFIRTTAWLAVAVVGGMVVRAAEPPALNPQLESLRPLLKTWRGTFKNSTPEKPVVDVMRWERVLNGQGVRILHSINNGTYGGETMVVWDAARKQLAFYYFTTAGFMTTGTIEVKDRKVVTHEQVRGSAEGITEVRGTSELTSDGKFLVKTEYLKQGQWVAGRETLYEEAPGAEVVFK